MKPGMENVWSTGVDPNILQYPENWLGGHLFDPILKRSVDIIFCHCTVNSIKKPLKSKVAISEK